jgi:hypothetical protein
MEEKLKNIEKIKQEIENKTKEYFNYYDIDHNGSISFVEWLKCEKALREVVKRKEMMNEFKTMDLDGDGNISLEECVVSNLKIFVEFVENNPESSTEELQDVGNNIIKKLDDVINKLNY